ncbi:helix-turn-helix domain-containing protein [Ramlibacter sp. MAH-25]|uniref:Helix-turn-helix domain-containing protein n=2 Tax=Comamonadaceae TaxID=80864 RepID=A0A6N8J0F6_9BURK|nr:IclR family transcriptional regulator [Ramlibacter sp. CGMCC 1.13660]MVQ32302.1 helix-turn-helix domain-containing protein [Ramlibacter pinisoli]
MIDRRAKEVQRVTLGETPRHDREGKRSGARGAPASTEAAASDLKRLLVGASPSASSGRDHETVNAVLRALSILTAFDGDEVYLPLAELARRTGLLKPTALRLARTLAAARFLVSGDDGTWRLGPAAGWIGSRYQAQFDLDSAIEPILRELSAQTGESASFFVFEGNLRSCLMRCEGPAGASRHMRTGEVFPLDRGSAGRVILAALGEPGDLNERIRRRGFAITRGERRSDFASVSAAVRGAHGTVLGSVSASGPVERLTVAVLRRHAPAILHAARQLGEVLGAMPASALRATWHPS